MYAEKGVVERIEDDWAWVLTRREAACEHCGHKGLCHMTEGQDRMLVKARNTAHARRGDEVALYLNSRVKLKGFFILYMFPVLGLLVGAFSAEHFSGLLGWNKSVSMVLFIASGLLLAILLARFFAGRMEAKEQLTPIVSRVVRRHKGNQACPTDTDPS